MGGLGSGRWRWYTPKITVEDCHKFPIKLIYRNLRPGYWGSVSWSRGERETGSISYRVEGNESPVAIRLIYTQTNRTTGKKTDFDYRVPLTTTPLPWGGVRYWFTCSLSKNDVYCGRRVGVIYLPPGYQYFGCRHCYELTYRSCQESHKFDGFYRDMAAMMQDNMPGVTGPDLRYLWEHDGIGNPPPEGYFSRRYAEILSRYIEDLENCDPRANYLTQAQLLERSGLSSSSLENLEAARLLLSDTKDGRYRPKLGNWARKLAYLLGEGWQIDEIKRWSKGRWGSSNPRQWPPCRDDWRE